MPNSRHSRSNAEPAIVSDASTQKKGRRLSGRSVLPRSSTFPELVPCNSVADFESFERQNQDHQYLLFNQHSESELQDCLTQLLLLEKAKQDVLTRTRRAVGEQHALQDYQMQLMLLEQQNKKRLMSARMEQAEEDRQQQGQDRSRSRTLSRELEDPDLQKSQKRVHWE